MLIYLTLKLKTIANFMTTNIAPLNQNKLGASTEPEIDLLLSCARSKINSQTQDKIALLLKNKIDWQYLLESSKRHKVLPLIYANLSNLKSDSIEEGINHDFHQIFQANIQRNLLLTSELLQILNFLQTNQIQAIPVKGPILARLAYSNFGLRSVSDLDLIVKRQDFAKTQQLLMEYGYQASPLNKEAYYQQAQYYKPNGVVGIDLHYEFAPKNHFAAVDSNLFWEHLESLPIADQQIPVFSLNYTIVHLCLEGAKEHWRSLSRICDLSELISNQEVDWNSLLTTADTLNKKKTVFVGLYLAHTLLKTPLPKNIWLEINCSLDVKLSREQICNFLFRHRQPNILVAIKWHFFNLQAFESLANKWKYITQAIKVNLKVNLINKFKSRFKFKNT